MRLNYMWSQPLIPSPKKPSPAIYTIPIPIMGSCAVKDMNGISISLLPFSPSVASWISSPVACAAWPAAVTPEFPTKAPVQVKDGPKGRMGMGWYGLTWERGKRSTLRKINAAEDFCSIFEVDWMWCVYKYTYVYMTTLWTSEPGLTTHAYHYPKL